MSGLLLGVEDGLARPLWAQDAGGVVVAPAVAADALRCAYPKDGFTASKSDGCGRDWCTPTKARCGFHDPWPPQHLGAMLEVYAARLRNGEFITFKGDETHRQYNEIVLDAKKWDAALPATIEAFFFPETSQCADGSPCQQAVRDSYAAFASEYGAAAAAVPLLRLRPKGTNPAFEAVETLT